MKVLRTLILVTVIAIIGACGLLKEKNEAALASTYSSLYAFFETASAGAAGCFPDQNNNNLTADTVIRAVYTFQIERPSTLVVCVKNTTTEPDPVTDSAGFANYHNVRLPMLTSHSINFFVSNTKINPGEADMIDNIRIPNIGGVISSPLMGAGLVCPFNTSDNQTFLVGRYDMYSLMEYKYIAAADESCGMCVGTGLSPFELARQYGVTY